MASGLSLLEKGCRGRPKCAFGASSVSAVVEFDAIVEWLMTGVMGENGGADGDSSFGASSESSRSRDSYLNEEVICDRVLEKPALVLDLLLGDDRKLQDLSWNECKGSSKAVESIASQVRYLARHLQMCLPTIATIYHEVSLPRTMLKPMQLEKASW